MGCAAARAAADAEQPGSPQCGGGAGNGNGSPGWKYEEGEGDPNTAGKSLSYGERNMFTPFARRVVAAEFLDDSHLVCVEEGDTFPRLFYINCCGDTPRLTLAVGTGDGHACAVQAMCRADGPLRCVATVSCDGVVCVWTPHGHTALVCCALRVAASAFPGTRGPALSPGAAWETTGEAAPAAGTSPQRHVWGAVRMDDVSSSSGSSGSTGSSDAPTTPTTPVMGSFAALRADRSPLPPLVAACAGVSAGELQVVSVCHRADADVVLVGTARVDGGGRGCGEAQVAYLVSSSRITAMSFAVRADTGPRLVCGCADGTVQIWDLSTRQCVRTHRQLGRRARVLGLSCVQDTVCRHLLSVDAEKLYRVAFEGKSDLSGGGGTIETVLATQDVRMEDFMLVRCLTERHVVVAASKWLAVLDLTNRECVKRYRLNAGISCVSRLRATEGDGGFEIAVGTDTGSIVRYSLRHLIS